MGMKDKLNPLKKLKEFKKGLPNLGELQEISKSQSEQIKIQIKEIQKQTILMERWANASELQLEQLERIAVSLEAIVEGVNYIKK